MYSLDELEAFVAQAIGGDVLAEAGGGFVGVMARSAPSIQKDIPVAFELYTLLEHFLKSLPIRREPISFDAPTLEIEPGIVVDQKGHKVVALLPIQAGQLGDVAFWLAEALPSREVKSLPGILALAFSVETHQDVKHLLPEWMAAFYVEGEGRHCVPILALKSVLEDERFGGDWVAVALHRLADFALPQAQAQQAAGGEVKTTR
ncbi:hypothetical protein I5S53_04810 [Pseudomonas juntendi]|uniref:hypothetical protein n=1 Tax=Pseudomonas TaxID=286 RepID=UPI000D89E105|nr:MULTISPECIES: hypothetical protein [Pseudomonas]MBH3383299.1 hypothetical protein [Pseudomonas juntendi]PYC07972.1 hypothetical protein DMX12_04905 [Pseudomonas sp. MB-090624]WBM32198.1 hypothetical protein M2J80_22125 [Pseudomonas sp. NY11382]